MRRKGRRVRNSNGELIRVLHVGWHFCIRCVKQGRSLKSLGYPISALTHTISYGTDSYDSVYFYHNERQFMSVMKDIGHLFQLVHLHNEPDHMTVWAYNARKEFGFKWPIIHDYHDVNSVRIGQATKDEIRVFRLADGLVFVSEPCQRLCKELYDFRQPSVVFSHYCNHEWDKYKNYTPGEEDRAKRHGVVYFGGLNPPNHLVPPERRQVFKYRTLYPYMKEAVAQGNEVIIFAGNPDGYQSHLDLGATVFPPTQYDEAMNRMKEYKWGWVIFGDPDDPQTRNTTCNKWFEVIKCGCVPICCWCEEQERWNKRYECGINLKDPSELGNIEQNFGHLYPKLKARVDEINMTGELDSENHIHSIESLWGRVMKS